MRISQFAVWSDEIFLNDSGDKVQLVLHSASGQVYILAASVLKSLIEAPSALSESGQRELSRAELLVDSARDEFGEIVQDNISHIAQDKSRTFVLMPAAYCNMGCGYCGQSHARLPVREQHRDAIRQRLLLATTDPSVTGVHVSWFGAEPMMGYAQILDLSASIIPACAAAGIPYTSSMVTNGTLLTPSKINRLCRGAGVTSFEITLDGPAATHDRQRPLKSGQASFSRIVPTIKAACDDDLPELSFTIRTNVSRANQDYHREFAAAMADAGLANPKVTFYTALVREWGNDVSDFAVAREDIISIERNWLEAYRQHGLQTCILPIDRKHQVCVTVSRSAEVIAPTGEVHSCTEQPLVPSRKNTHIGHVTDLQTPQVRPAGQYDKWNQSLLGDTAAFCPTCAIFPICGGACPLVWNEGKPACPPFKVTMPMLLSQYGRSLGLQSANE